MSCCLQFNDIMSQAAALQSTTTAPPPKPKLQLQIDNHLRDGRAKEVWAEYPAEAASIVANWIADPKRVKGIHSAPKSIYALAAAGGDRTADITSSFINSPDKDVRKRAVEVVDKADTPKVVHLFIDLLANSREDEDVYELSLAGLLRYGDDALPSLMCALKDSDQNRVSAAVNILGRMRGNLPVRLLMIKAASSSCTPQMAEQIETCLKGMSSDRTVPEMVFLTQHSVPSVRFKIWQRISQFASRSRSNAWKLHNHLHTIEIVAADEPDDGVRREAVKAQAAIIAGTKKRAGSL